MRPIRLGLLLAAGAYALAATPARAQDAICCMRLISLGGNWIGAIRLSNCQDYFNKAPSEILRRMCQQRDALPCINTSRCSELPPGEIRPPETPSPPAALPLNPDREGLAGGFGGAPPAPTSPPAPPVGGVSPPRLVYLIMGVPSGGKPVSAFTVFLDRAGCLVPMADNNQPADRAAARHVVRGRISRGDGRVRIEAEANELAGGTKLGPFTGEAEGVDAAAVAKATRAVVEKMKLVCAR
jgi:hypothetical protein